jgi:hypothetical protein
MPYVTVSNYKALLGNVSGKQGTPLASYVSYVQLNIGNRCAAARHGHKGLEILTYLPLQVFCKNKLINKEYNILFNKKR